MDNEFKETVQRALNKAYFYLKFRPRSEKEVRDYLLKKGSQYGWSSEVIEASMTSLKENDFVNDESFVEWFVQQRNAAKPKSAFALKHELQKFGIQKDLASKYFEESPVEEEDLAYKALLRKWSRFQYLDKKERFQKAAAFLSRRGFSFDIIKKSIRRFEEE
jgi:regulatory protein